jgi:hypothetical protein
MKHETFIILFCLYCLGASAQERTIGKKILHYQQHDERAIHFGFCVGLNVMDFTVTPSYENNISPNNPDE